MYIRWIQGKDTSRVGKFFKGKKRGGVKGNGVMTNTLSKEPLVSTTIPIARPLQILPKGSEIAIRGIDSKRARLITNSELDATSQVSQSEESASPMGRRYLVTLLYLEAQHFTSGAVSQVRLWDHHIESEIPLFSFILSLGRAPPFSARHAAIFTFHFDKLVFY